jgi:hypothetical protein
MRLLSALCLIWAVSSSGSLITSEAAVCRTVVGVHTAERSSGSPTFVNLDKAYPNQVFTILIWGSDIGKFTPAPSTWSDKSVCATTKKIELYRNVPEIVAKDAGQISFPK